MLEAEKEIERLRDESASWEEQASDRTDDAVRFIKERDVLLSEVEALRGALAWTIENCTYQWDGDLYGGPCSCCASPIEVPPEYKPAIDAARGEKSEG